MNNETATNHSNFAMHIAEASPPSIPHVRSIAVTSGKGGVGKTNFVVNVALELAALGRKVTLLDADLALANTNVLLGINPAFHVGHLLSGQRSLEDIVVQVGPRVRLIPGSSGVEEMANLSYAQHGQFIAELEAMEDESDYLLIDTPSGIGNNVVGILSGASEVVVVTMPEPTALIDAYATIKTIHQHFPWKRIWVAVSSVIGIGDGETVFAQLSEVSKRFLGHRIEYLGAIFRDVNLIDAVREQRPVVEHAPDRPASRSFRLIAKHLDRARPFSAKAPGETWQCAKEAQV